MKTIALLLAAVAIPAIGAESPSVDTEALLKKYVAEFNADDIEYYTNTFSNADVEKFMLANCPRFTCPDKDIERTYYFRWWTYRKHVRRTKAGEWVVTEFLPNVGWAGYENTISCPMNHHVREGRWLANKDIIKSYIATIVAKGNIHGEAAYGCVPAWCALKYARNTGDYELALSLLPKFVENYEEWERGWTVRDLSMPTAKIPNRYDLPTFKSGFKPERGLFDFSGDREGTEFALSADGARPMINSMMCAEAKAISEIAMRKGDADLSKRFAEKASALERNIMAKLWNPKQKFFTSIGLNGKQDDVCELHGLAPYYFGLKVEDKCAVMFDALTDEKGFAGPLGLTYPRRDTPGFDNTFHMRWHPCLWNGPSWPYATSIALTAFANHLQSQAAKESEVYTKLLSQFAKQHRRTREDGKVICWIDEDVDAFNGMWLARQVGIERREADKNDDCKVIEEGKDYNHSSFCDLVISGLVGFVPESDGFSLKPLFPRSWKCLKLDHLTFRGRDIAIAWDGNAFTVTVNGKLVTPDARGVYPLR